MKIHTTTAEGSEVVLGFSGPGELLGEISAVRDTVRGANATAMTPVEGVSVSVSALRAFLTRHPRATVALLDLVLARLLVADVRRMEFASSESLGRVASRLVELAERFGSAASTGAIDIGLPFPPGGAGVVELVVARVDEPRAANRRPAAVRAGARLAGGRDRRWTERLRPPRRCSSPSPIFPSATVTSPSPYSTASTG